MVIDFEAAGSIHIFFEGASPSRETSRRNHCLTKNPGYYVSNYKDLASMQTLFAQLWKEYALADSRYLTRDPLVLCLETITAVWLTEVSFHVYVADRLIAIPGSLGSIMLHCRWIDYQGSFPETSSPDHCVPR